MNNWTRGEVTTTRVEYAVPAGDSYWNALRQVICAIEHELGDAADHDNAARLEARDDEIVLSFVKPPEPPF